MTRDQDRLIQSQTRLAKGITACLKAYYPVALQLWSPLQQPSTLTFLQAYPTPEAAMAASMQQIEQTLRQGHHSNPRHVASTIDQALHQPHLQADESTTRTKSRLRLPLVKQLRPVVQSIAEYDKAMTDLFLPHEDLELFSSLPRAGMRLAPRRFLLDGLLGLDIERSFSANFHPSLQNRSTLQLIYQQGRE